MSNTSLLQTSATGFLGERAHYFWQKAALAGFVFCLVGPSHAGEILLSQFSGQESIITISEIPGGGLQGALGAPADNWSRTVNGVQFIGGKELTLMGRTSSGDGGNPFRSAPLSGDPNGFSGASFGSSLAMFIPSAWGGFSLGFSGLSEMPRRVGLNLSSYANPAITLRTTLFLADSTTETYLYDQPILRLLAYESGTPISRVEFSWTTFVPGDGPGIEIDDIRFEAVPEPSTWALGLMGIACGGWVAWRKRKRSLVNHSLLTPTVCFALALSGIVPARAVTIDMVTVGDAGNVADTTGYGAVGYEYRIGKYEVTIGQYTDFLNAVAKSDPHYLYDASMASDLNTAGISRTGTSGGYTYSVIDNGGSSGNRPIANISWFCAARFANWMHNGQGSGSTETGAYTLNGDFYGTAPGKNFGATFYIPTEDEWYKAAYYSPTLNSGAGGYYTYATQSDTAPGNVVGSVANHANYTVDGIYSVTQSYWSSVSRNCLNDVGAFTNSASYYGTFDQSGNLEEWNDLAGASGSSRGWRGGSWGHGHASYLASSTRSAYDPAFDYPLIGFRLAAPVAVPEPSTWLMGLAGLVCGACAFRRRRP
jgi:sulfatase modifying factor 1